MSSEAVSEAAASWASQEIGGPEGLNRWGQDVATAIEDFAYAVQRKADMLEETALRESVIDKFHHTAARLRAVASIADEDLNRPVVMPRW